MTEPNYPEDFPRLALMATSEKSGFLKLAGVVSLPKSEMATVQADSVSLEDFMRDAWVSAGGSRDTSAAIAFPRSIKLYNAGSKLPNECTALTACLWLSCILLDTDLAREFYKKADSCYFKFCAGSLEGGRMRIKQVGIFDLEPA